MSIRSDLFALAEESYGDFQSRLLPTIDRDKIIGVRIPILRRYAKDLLKESAGQDFMADLPHDYYDEQMLQGLMISQLSDYDQVVARLADFLPHIDNWAVCDSLRPQIFSQHRADLIKLIPGWLASDHAYTVRFAINMLIVHFLGADFNPAQLDWVGQIKRDDYYIQMAMAWYFASALTKQWQAAITYFEQANLPIWVHNKTIQKARESRQISSEAKAYLNSLKRKQDK
ncbi:DNA alkylation repair protein [Aerococcus urinaehominis]|uniref:DNA alkylation repair protein n=1 Tax=Aerococcus urinaehominis TaxID=128944 RepID=A0A109RI58_9LACT|nr:DNA alkylation repair protein [Aerococcus urinaehominis]AMC00002.1 DNA alkylation repair protein [Aerococcus urinaehominis]SDL82371.1 3-methyladenine DNA glycosylase AlkD [Aerococcus urinaehominis]